MNKYETLVRLIEIKKEYLMARGRNEVPFHPKESQKHDMEIIKIDNQIDLLCEGKYD